MSCGVKPARTTKTAAVCTSAARLLLTRQCTPHSIRRHCNSPFALGIAISSMSARCHGSARLIDPNIDNGDAKPFGNLWIWNFPATKDKSDRPPCYANSAAKLRKQ
ncbi:unnamed protein product [Leptosia nina]|uniref:Uncharacterized protein n=1 Tax=Leptosia nina TaxID=320188 RepID=A0AAV1K251_9NEOP